MTTWFACIVWSDGNFTELCQGSGNKTKTEIKGKRVLETLAAREKWNRTKFANALDGFEMISCGGNDGG